MEIILVFIIGLIFGSFLNVIIYRLKNDLPVSGRSFCPECKTRLKWHDLAPIFSFIYLRGRCRYCRQKISWQYPVVELLSGLLWVGVFYKIFGSLGFEIWDFFLPPVGISAQTGISDFGFLIFDFIYYIYILSAFLVIAVYDARWKIIPDKIVYPTIILVLIFNLFNAFKFQNIGILKYSNITEIFILPLFTAFIAFLFFFLIYFFSKGRAMGLGDAKLAFLIGLFLTPKAALLAFGLAFVVGAAFGIILMGLGRFFPRYQKWGLKSQIAFGPFMVFGAAAAFFFPDFIFKLLNF